MKKTKLLQARVQRGLTQNEIAVLANMDQSTYARKEKGTSKITSREWKKLASILDVSLKDIFEDDVNKFDISGNNELEDINEITKSSKLCKIPEYVLENLKNYIQKLQEENNRKENELIVLREEISKLKR